MANAKIEGASPNEILKIKNNPPEPTDIVLVLNPDAFIDLENSPEKFYEHYQNLAPTREEQEQRLKEINIQLYDYCLIPCDFQFCDNCDLIYNPPPRMIYTIPKEEEPINSCASESKLSSNPDSNFNNNNNENNGSSSVQNGYNNDNDSNSDSNSNSNYEQYITLPDLTKEQKLKWFSDKNESIMPEHVHDTDARFDLRYPEKNAIKLEPHSCICIDLKIALEILATTIVQLASRSSLAKKGINIREGIIDTGYIRNIIAILQNDSEKTYVIEPNERITQAIFLSLVKIAQLVLVENREELEITTKGIQGFELMSRINVPVNMIEEEIIGQEEIISTGQTISIPPYSQYILAIERREKKQEQIFEAEATLCESGEIGLINLHIPVKSHNHIKIPIYNNTENVVKIPEKTTFRYLTMKIEDQAPSSIPDFPQLCEYPEQLEQMNIRNLDPLQQMQLKMLLNNFNNIFASKNEFGRTDIIQHQIKTGDTMPIKQQAYRVPPASHKIIYQEINRMLDNRAVLSQRELDGREHLVTYASQSLTSAEKNYKTLELEHLAIYWAVMK
ncbi:hypothetical protein G9A89_013924 [Geosiphon pyriformis]|nr:hypothetical protein G9A89_013924 [Geosiphon pyriformis]